MVALLVIAGLAATSLIVISARSRLSLAQLWQRTCQTTEESVTPASQSGRRSEMTPAQRRELIS